MRYGSLFDSTQTMVAEIGDGLYEGQVVSWYDNENSYTSQMVREQLSIFQKIANHNLNFKQLPYGSCFFILEIFTKFPVVAIIGRLFMLLSLSK